METNGFEIKSTPLETVVVVDDVLSLIAAEEAVFAVDVVIIVEVMNLIVVIVVGPGFLNSIRLARLSKLEGGVVVAVNTIVVKLIDSLINVIFEVA